MHHSSLYFLQVQRLSQKNHRITTVNRGRGHWNNSIRLKDCIHRHIKCDRSKLIRSRHPKSWYSIVSFPNVNNPNATLWIHYILWCISIVFVVELYFFERLVDKIPDDINPMYVTMKNGFFFCVLRERKHHSCIHMKRLFKNTRTYTWYNFGAKTKQAPRVDDRRKIWCTHRLQLIQRTRRCFLYWRIWISNRNVSYISLFLVLLNNHTILCWKAAKFNVDIDLTPVKLFWLYLCFGCVHVVTFLFRPTLYTKYVKSVPSDTKKVNIKCTY